MLYCITAEDNCYKWKQSGMQTLHALNGLNGLTFLLSQKATEATNGQQNVL